VLAIEQDGFGVGLGPVLAIVEMHKGNIALQVSGWKIRESNAS